MNNQYLPALQARELIDFAQQDYFFQLALAKNARMAVLKESFNDRSLHKLWLGPRLASFDCEVPAVDIDVLPTDFFQVHNDQSIFSKIKKLENSIVIVSNNDIASQEARAIYAELVSKCTSTCFVAWDWDNHHWLDLSTFLAAHSDIYAPSHHENLYILSRYNWQTIGPIYCTTEQWPRKFLSNHLDSLLLKERSNDPLGMHIAHPTFSFRMQIVKTLNSFYPSVGFSTAAFHNRTREDRLQEWSSHKSHWIAPVLNDVPVRLFDALITGGIPIVPLSMQYLPPVNKIPREFIVFYSVNDIVNPDDVVKRASKLFDHFGKEGIAARHRFALEHHHGDVSIRSIISFANESLISNSNTAS
jgi:hypothetical protein